MIVGIGIDQSRFWKVGEIVKHHWKNFVSGIKSISVCLAWKIVWKTENIPHNLCDLEIAIVPKNAENRAVQASPPDGYLLDGHKALQQTGEIGHSDWQQMVRFIGFWGIELQLKLFYTEKFENEASFIWIRQHYLGYY